jgi:hypothetical protein
MSKTEEAKETIEDKKPELIFKVTTNAKATDKTPGMTYLSATNDLIQWNDVVKKDLKEARCNDEQLNDLVLAEHGFWASDKAN